MGYQSYTHGAPLYAAFSMLLNKMLPRKKNYSSVNECCNIPFKSDQLSLTEIKERGITFEKYTPSKLPCESLQHQPFSHFFKCVLSIHVSHFIETHFLFVYLNIQVMKQVIKSVSKIKRANSLPSIICVKQSLANNNNNKFISLKHFYFYQ